MIDEMLKAINYKKGLSLSKMSQNRVKNIDMKNGSKECAGNTPAPLARGAAPSTPNVLHVTAARGQHA